MESNGTMHEPSAYGDTDAIDPWADFIGSRKWDVDQEARLAWALTNRRTLILSFLRRAAAGGADYGTKGARYVASVDPPIFELVHVGEKAIPGYWQHGGFWVDRAGVFRSRLTQRGEALLADIEAST